MNLFTNLYNLISNQYKYIFGLVYIKYNIIYSNWASHVQKLLFTNTLLYLSLTHLIIKPKLGFELDLFIKKNIHTQY